MASKDISFSGEVKIRDASGGRGKMKILVVALIAVLVANLYGFASGQFDTRTFWAVIIVMALLAYFVVPKLQMKE